MFGLSSVTPLAAQSYTFSVASTVVSNAGGVVADPNGGSFVSTFYGNIVYRLSPAGTVLAQYGSGTGGWIDGSGTAARFFSPRGLALDTSGNLYVADTNNHAVRKISPQGGVTTLAGAGSTGSVDGTGSAARFNYPQGLAVDNTGNVYVTDTSNHTIRKITPAGVVSTVAGAAGDAGASDGSGNAARFHFPQGLAIDSAGNLYVADASNHIIRKITPAGLVSTLAGSAGNYGAVDGPVAIARLTTPTGVAVDRNGNLFVADSGSLTIRKISAGVVTTIAGLAGSGGDASGVGSAARFYNPRGIAVDVTGNLLVAENGLLKVGTPSGQLAITVQPQSLAVGSGSAAALSVTATGATPITYQWQKNGASISGATNAMFTVPSVQSADAGTYTVIVANAVGTLASVGATLTVLAAVPNDNFGNAQSFTGTSGSLSGNNSGATGEPGEPLHGAVAATTSSVWYKWTPEVAGTVVLNITGSSFPVGMGVWTGEGVGGLTRVAIATGTRLSLRVQAGVTYHLAIGSSNPTSRGNFTLNWRMIVNDDFANAQPLGGDSGSVTGNNDGASAEAGEPAHYASSAAASTSVWYRWTALQDAVVTFTTAGASNMVIQVYTGSSISALSSVTPATVAPLSGNGRSQLVFVARAGISYAMAVGSYYYSPGPFTLTWQSTPAPVILGGVASASVTAPAVTSSTTAVQARAGTPVVLEIGYFSATPATIEWRRNGIVLPSATEPRVTLASVQAGDTGSYTATVTNRVGSVTTSPVVVTVIIPPGNDNFADAQIIAGLNGRFTGSNVNATGENGEPVHWNAAGAASSVWYRWSPNVSGLAVVDTVGSAFDTVLAVYTGSTLSTLSRLIQDDDRGGGRASQVSFAANGGTTYYIAIGGNTLSARGSIVLNWQLTPTVAITAAPVSQTISIGGTATFTVQASGTGLTYQWFRNGDAIPGATTATLTLGSVQAGQDASYTVRVGNGTAVVTSEPATLAVAAPATTALALRRTRAEGDLLWSIAAGGGEIVTVGSFGVILSSSDNGSTWTPRNSGSTGWLVAVTYGGGQFVIVGEGGLILTSPNGREWTRATSSGTNERLNGVIYADGKYVAVGERGVALTSIDARVWTPRSTPVNTWLHGIAYHAGARQFATVGENAVVLISPDGVNWTRLPVPGFTRALQQVVAVDSYANFVAVGEEGMVVSVRQNEFADKDGQTFTTWTTETRPTGTNTHYIGLVQGAGALFAMGYDGKVISATNDRGPWATVSSGTNGLLLAGTFHNDTLYAVGERETVLQSDRLFSSRLINISTRGQVGTGSNVMISGFVITGTAPKQVLIRAAGPTLGSFGLSGTLATPVLTLFDHQNRVVGSNAGWTTSANSDAISAAAARVAAFPFAAGSADSALLVTLNPGQYTAQVAGAGTTTGLGIVEVYDGDSLNNEGSRTINISTRGVAGSGANKMIAGFIIHGAAARRVLIRAVGPALEKFGVSGTLAEPQLEVYNSRGLLHTTAGAWGLQSNAEEIRGSAKAVSAFDLPEGGKDSAMVLTLMPGAWTVQVGGPGNTTGVVLVEVYAVP